MAFDFVHRICGEMAEAWAYTETLLIDVTMDFFNGVSFSLAGKLVRRFLMASRLEALTCAGIWHYIQNREDDDDTESESK